MRKRLRQQMPLGACVAWGVPMAIRRRHPEGCDDFLDLSLSLGFRDASHLERVTGGTWFPCPLPGVSPTRSAQTLDPPAASHTVTTRYRSPYGHVRLHLAQSPEETAVGVLIDVVTFCAARSASRRRLDLGIRRDGAGR
jgi:hypothetical protein